jgi:hypothetical protein
MRDAGKARRSIYSSVSEDLIQKHPKMFNIFLALVLISLIAMGAFLLSDILSFKSNPTHKGLFSGLDLKVHQGNIKTVETWQEIGIRLMDQFKSILEINSHDNAKPKKAANSNKARALMAKNKVSKTKEAHASVKNLSHQVPLNSSNSSRTQTLVQSAKEADATIIEGADFDSGSDTPVKNSESSPSNDNSVAYQSNGTGAVPSNEVIKNETPENDPQKNETNINEFRVNETMNCSQIKETRKNETLINESMVNETQIDESLITESQVNESRTNQTQISEAQMNGTQMTETQFDESLVKDTQIDEPQTNESQLKESRINQTQITESRVNETQTNETLINDSQIVKSLTNESRGIEPRRASDPDNNTSTVPPEARLEGNKSMSSPYLFIAGKPEHPSDNLSSGSIDSARSRISSMTSNTTEVGGRIAPDKNSSAVSVPQESDRVNNKTYGENDTCNLAISSSSIRDEKTQKQSRLSEPSNGDKILPVISKAPNCNASVNNTPVGVSNIKSNKMNKSLESIKGNSNSSELSTGAVLANNITSHKIQEHQNASNNNLTKTGQSQGKSSISAMSSFNNGAEISQNHASQNHTGANSKNVVYTKVSAQSQESPKKQTNNINRFRTLKIPTPPWMKKK